MLCHFPLHHLCSSQVRDGGLEVYKGFSFDRYLVERGERARRRVSLYQEQVVPTPGGGGFPPSMPSNLRAFPLSLPACGWARARMKLTRRKEKSLPICSTSPWPRLRALHSP